MSVTRFGGVVAEAAAAGRCVGAFTCYDSLGIEGVVRAAERHAAPVIVLVGPGSFVARGGARLVAAFRGVAAGAGVELLLQLDHVADREVLARAAAAGVDAVMADGSKLPDAENEAFASAVVRDLRPHGIAVEAELGRVEGDEDLAVLAAAGRLTDPAGASDFVRATAVDALAVSIGNVHGRYEGPPQLDWERLEALGAAGAPLSLHGASGLPDADVRRAVGLGIAKANVNTELRAAYFGVLEAETGPRSGALDLKGLGEAVIEAVADVAGAKLALFGWPAA